MKKFILIAISLLSFQALASLRCKIERIDRIFGQDSPMSMTFTLDKCSNGVTLPSTDLADEPYQYNICRKGYWITGRYIQVKVYDRSYLKRGWDALKNGKTGPITELTFNLDQIAEGVSLYNNTTIRCK